MADWAKGAAITREYLEDLRPGTFERWMDRVAGGGVAVIDELIAENEHKGLYHRAAFVKWIHADPERDAAYMAACRTYAELLAHDCIRIADGGSEDVARDKLAVDTRLRLAGKWYRERYGESVKTGDAPQVVLNLSFGGEPQSVTIEADNGA